MSDAMRPDIDGHALHWIVRPHQQRWLQRLLDGELAPLRGFLDRRDYDSVLHAMHLADGTPWPFPVTLDVDEAFAAALDVGAHVELRDRCGQPLARLELSDIYYPDHLREARLLYGQMDRRHPAMVQLLCHTGPVYLGGQVHDLRASPAPRTPAIDAVHTTPSSHDAWRAGGAIHATEPGTATGSRLLH